MRGNELDLYTTQEPSHALAFGIFEGAWISDIPGYGFGDRQLFDDGRVPWLNEQCGGIRGKSVLELGPLEGGHTYMLANAGASRVVAIESNSKMFLKCLLVQNALKFNAEFLYGDFRKFLAKREQQFDILLASGVLYHMTDPVALLEDMAAVSTSICLWTHYYDADALTKYNGKFRPQLDTAPTFSAFRGRRVELHRLNYLQELDKPKFAGGSAPHSHWMTRESLFGVLEDLGMTVTIGLDHVDHPAGPSVLLFATRIPGFDERAYLGRHPDVARAVRNGQFKTGAEHYIRFGKNEGRAPG